MPKAKKTQKKEDPCWKGYEQAGMKDKDGKQAPKALNRKSNLTDSRRRY
jgi:hypothetical protein